MHPKVFLFELFNSPKTSESYITYMDAFVHTWMHSCIHGCIRAYMDAFVHACVRAWSYIGDLSHHKLSDKGVFYRHVGYNSNKHTLKFYVHARTHARIHACIW